MSSRPGLALLFLVLLLPLPACARWVEHGPEPPAAGDGDVRVTKTSQETVVLSDPFTERGAYVGRVHGITTRVPLDSIATFEVKETDWPRTLFAAVGVPVVGLGLAFLALALDDAPLGGG